MKLTLELSETQAYILRDALDAYSRLLAGQIEIAVMDAATWFFLERRKYEPQDGIEHFVSPEILRQNLMFLQASLTGLERGASHGIHSKEIPDRARQAYDLQQAIRHAVAWHLHPEKAEHGLRTVDFDMPMRTSEKEELPKCEVS